MMASPLEPEKIPPLLLMRHHTSKQSRRADAVRKEEYRRLALCWIYRQPVPTEAVHAMLNHGSGAFALMEYATAIMKAVNLLYGARKFADQMGGRVDISGLVDKTVSRYHKAITSIKLETGNQARLRGWHNDNVRAGRPYDLGNPNLAPGEVEGPATRWEPAPKFNPQALRNANRSLASICTRLGYDYTYAVQHPEEVADHLGVSAQQPVVAGLNTATSAAERFRSNLGLGADVGAAAGGTVDTRQHFAGMHATGIGRVSSAGVGAGSMPPAKRARQSTPDRQ